MATAPPPTARTDYNALVAEADAIYFPSERVGSGSRSDPARLLIDAFRRSGAPFAIGWFSVEQGQQPLLDEIASQPAPDDELLARLDLLGSGRLREHTRSVLRATAGSGVRHIALRIAPQLFAALNAGGEVAAEELRQLPRGFRVPADEQADFDTRSTASGRLGDRSRTFRAHVAAQQVAAERIVQHFRTTGGKLLVFAPADDLRAGRGVPFYVSQRIKLRQLVLGSDREGEEARRLWTRRAGEGGQRRVALEIVNRSPGAARN